MTTDSPKPFTFKVGDKVLLKHGSLIEILEARKTGYTWKYLDDDEDYISENSNDPFFWCSRGVKI